ncbi:molybdopterin adenylyltransferase [Oligella urethralis]|uniref:Molybdopterin adenylyltransferase n=1 Tax=Oligella urethralis DNF00040 TaxID=1401065 RepID=A0A095Z5P2_9BURK|nr:molybdopterin adenylyltransferase [Oligella urethralis]KGF29988.1 molybdenum cofactor biosynthesis protein MogA [Oligella urethralis DNF00040]
MSQQNDFAFELQTLKVGVVSVSDRASQGIYEDEGLPGLKAWLDAAVINPIEYVPRLIPDELDLISMTLRELADEEQCHLILTTGGTGPTPRDVTPEATLAVAERVVPGFGEQMRQISLNFIPTGIISRQVGVLRGSSVILNLPGRPKAIAETLGGLKGEAGKQKVHGIFASVPFCIESVSGLKVRCRPEICNAVYPGEKWQPL